VAPEFACVAVVRLLPAEHDWGVAKSEKTVTDLAWVKAGEDLAVEGEVSLPRDRFEPRAGLEVPKPLVAAVLIR
jgi:hypothetical protein